MGLPLHVCTCVPNFNISRRAEPIVFCRFTSKWFVPETQQICQWTCAHAGAFTYLLTRDCILYITLKMLTKFEPNRLIVFWGNTTQTGKYQPFIFCGILNANPGSSCKTYMYALSTCLVNSLHAGALSSSSSDLRWLLFPGFTGGPPDHCSFPTGLTSGADYKAEPRRSRRPPVTGSHSARIWALIGSYMRAHCDVLVLNYNVYKLVLVVLPIK